MSIESRMDEFQKVAEKSEGIDDVTERMDEFQKVLKEDEISEKERASGLPYGLKEHLPCPGCGEMMTIHEVKEKEAVYCCRTCGQRHKITIK